MADEYELDGRRVVKAKIARWQIRQGERALFESADQVPNWRLADKSRRLLADFCHHLSGKLPSIVGSPLKDVDRDVLKREALISAASIIVRAAGSGMANIACGYQPESAGPARRAFEAKLNARAVVDDPSGEYALRYLQGRSRGLQKLADRYGGGDDLPLLSQLSHADVRGLSRLYVKPPRISDQVTEGEINLMPSREDQSAGLVAYLLAYEAVEMCSILAEEFGIAFEVPPWVSGELHRQGEAVRAAAP